MSNFGIEQKLVSAVEPLPPEEDEERYLTVILINYFISMLY